MEELVINGQTYEFKFGIGFLRDMNKMIAVPVKEVPGMKKDVGFNYYAAEMLGGDVEALVMILNAANKGQNPRITPAALEAYVEDPDTDIDELFDKVKDFLLGANVTKKATKFLVEQVEKELAEAEMQN